MLTTNKIHRFFSANRLLRPYLVARLVAPVTEPVACQAGSSLGWLGDGCSVSLLTIPIERLDDAVARLKRLGFEVAEGKETRGLLWALARNADGTAFELVEVQAGAARELEIGLVVPDLAKARNFFTGVYGAKELPETTSRLPPGERELRFTTGATVFKCWAPKGERESDTAKIPDVLGFRYITHNVRDTQALHDALTAKGAEVASPLASHQG
jgi:hypothetical protein